MFETELAAASAEIAAVAALAAGVAAAIAAKPPAPTTPPDVPRGNGGSAGLPDVDCSASSSWLMKMYMESDSGFLSQGDKDGAEDGEMSAYAADPNFVVCHVCQGHRNGIPPSLADQHTDSCNFGY